MLKLKPALPILLCLLVAVSTQVLAQPHLSGNLSGTLGPGSYIVNGNCTVQAGATLTIAAGTTFLHSGAFNWSIYGLMTANGTQIDSIKWVRQSPSSSNWGGLRFLSGASSSCLINYGVVEYCTQAGSTVGGGIFTQSVPITVTNTRISNCTTAGGGGGIYANSANIVVDHCLIVSNNCPSGGNGGGIYLLNCSAPRISGSVIAYNTDTGT